MVWTAYAMPPIDLGWEFLPTVEELASRVAREEAAAAVKDYAGPPFEFATLMRHFEAAKEAASGAGWEGDFKGYSMPRVFFIPDETTFAYGFVWKQPNNGTTYVVSQYKFPWL